MSEFEEVSMAKAGKALSMEWVMSGHNVFFFILAVF
jgi:hypothetical protein